MLSQAATSADHLPAIQSVFLSRLLDIRTAPTYSPRAMLPQPLDLDASMETIGLQPERTYWPPTAPTSPLYTELLGFNNTFNQLKQNGGGLDGQGFNSEKQTWNPNDFLAPPGYPQGDQNFQHLQNITLSNQNQQAGPHQLPIPEVPTSSLALSLGSFVGDTSVRDVLFSNDSFW